jgi:hypothetical protein
MNLIILSSILSLVEAAQILLIIWRFAALKPLIIFVVFIACVIGGQCVAMSVLLKRWEQAGVRKSFQTYFMMEAVLAGLLLSASYKLVIYDFQPQLAHGAFDAVMVLAILNKIFWKQIQGFLVSLYAFLTDPANKPALILLIDAGFVIFIVLFIYVPDVKAVIARMFVGEQFHHWDLFMAPAWGYLKGLLPYVDIISQYGVGIPMLMGYGSHLFGGFSYEHVLSLLVMLCIIYYVASYVFLRCWLKSLPLVIIAMLIGLKTQMFHTGVSPFVFTYPSSTVIRNFFDVFFFLCIWGHLTTARRWLLWMAALICVLAEFNLIDTGVYLIGAFYVYLFLMCWLPDLRGRLLSRRSDWLHAGGCFLAVPIGVLVLFYAVVGDHVFTKIYWDNMMEYIIYFLAGHGMIPYSESLHYHYFWASLMGFIVPLVYVASILVLGFLCFQRRIHSRHVLVIVLCVYGLGLYHYYVARTAVTSYYVSGLPFIFVICFWLQKILDRIHQDLRMKILMGIAVFCWFALWTNHQVLAYPNSFNLSRNPMTDPVVTLPFPDQRGYFDHLFINYGPEYKLPANSLGETDEWLLTQRDFPNDDQVKRFYDQEFDFSKDAKLIASLTGPDEKVAILSSFEVKMLMQADRKPFFYFSPFLFSRPMHMRIFPLEGVHSAAYLKKTMGQLEDTKPPYVFMERIFLVNQVPAGYLDDVPRLLTVINYVRTYYKPYAYGKYLVAMKKI